jgi:hypothetical protein
MSQTTLINNLGYEGKVTLTLKSNGRILESKTYKNNGTAQLFKFLGYCLIGSFEEAKGLLPRKILLLHNNSSSVSIADINPTDVIARTIFQPLTLTPSIISDSQTAQVKVVYNFEIPRAAIEGPFNQVALYSDKMKYTDISDFSAYYYFTDALGNLETINIEAWSATTVLLIEWELTLSNKNTETKES